MCWRPSVCSFGRSDGDLPTLACLGVRCAALAGISLARIWKSLSATPTKAPKLIEVDEAHRWLHVRLSGRLDAQTAKLLAHSVLERLRDLGGTSWSLIVDLSDMTLLPQDIAAALLARFVTFPRAAKKVARILPKSAVSTLQVRRLWPLNTENIREFKDGAEAMLWLAEA